MPDVLRAARFHHIGVACRNLDAEASRLAVLAYEREGDDFHDPVQGIRGRFLVGPPGTPRLELLTDDGSRDVLKPWLESGTKLYHLAYEVDDLDGAIRLLQGARARVVSTPVPAVAFDGRRITFMMLPNMLLVELIAGETADRDR